MDNKQLVAYCDDMRNLFVSEGWTWVKAELENLRTQTRDIEAIKSIEELHFNKGIAHAAAIILSLPESVKDLEESIEDSP